MSTTISQPIVSVSYYIRAQYFYYSGTFNAPTDGALRDESGRRLEFASRKEAEYYLTRDGYDDPDCFAINCREFAPNKFTHPTTYILSHGEYSSPVYTIRKVPVSARV